MSSLNDILDVSCGKHINLKDYEEGSTIVHKNGSKTYSKNIPSNLPQKDCILITAMSVDIMFIDKENTQKHYASAGCFIITLKEDNTTVLLKYLFFCLSAFGVDKALKNKRKGSLQQFLNKSTVIEVFKSVGLQSV